MLLGRETIGHHASSRLAAETRVARKTVRLSFVPAQVRRIVQQDVGWEDWHGVSQGTKLIISVGEAAAACKFTNA
jgi:hypothetical protein